MAGEKKVRKKMTIHRTVVLVDFLRGVCSKGEDGRAVYDGEWTDAKVLAHFGSEFSIANVQECRRQTIGELKTGYRSISEEILELTGEMNALLSTVAELSESLDHVMRWASRREVDAYPLPQRLR